VNRTLPLVVITVLLSLCGRTLAQTPSEVALAPQAGPFVVTWKPDAPGCDDRYFRGLEEKGMSTNGAILAVVLIPDSGKLAVSAYVKNPTGALARLDVIPQNFHLFKVTDKGLSELTRADAVKMAKSKERRTRIVQSIGAGLSAAGSQTTANGTVDYSDGTTATYSVTMPDPQAQRDAIDRAHRNIGKAQAEGAYLIRKELKLMTLDPGQDTMGRLFFPNQKDGENLLVRIDLGNVRYEFPFHLLGKHEAPQALSTGPREDSRPPQQAAIAAPINASPTMPADPVQRVAWYRGAADRGDAGAQSELGVLYASGHGVPQDYAQAVAWFRKAAEQGNAQAQFNLGTAYRNGQGVPQDYTQAADWFRKAADQGLANAQFSLGVRYARGQGVPQDYAQAEAWLRKAAEQGYAPAQNNLGDLYENGHGVSQDYAQAVLWYRRAAEQGDAVAQFGLGSLYANGHGLQQDYAEAYFWLNLAASKGKGKEQEKYAKARDDAAAKLNSAEITIAQKRAADWFTAHPSQP